MRRRLRSPLLFTPNSHALNCPNTASSAPVDTGLTSTCSRSHFLFHLPEFDCSLGRGNIVFRTTKGQGLEEGATTPRSEQRRGDSAIHTGARRTECWSQWRTTRHSMISPQLLVLSNVFNLHVCCLSLICSARARPPTFEPWATACSSKHPNRVFSHSMHGCSLLYLLLLPLMLRLSP